MERERTSLLLVRHGHTVGGDERRYKGHIDVELSAQGEEEMRELSQRLLESELVPRAVYCSDLKRARRSAAILSEPLGLTPVVVPELRERSFGRWEGMSFEEIAAEYPREFGNWTSDPLRFAPPGGESTLAVKERTLGAVGGLVEEHRGERFCIVAHGGVNRVILCHFMGLPLEHFFRIEQDYGCLNVIDLYGDGLPVIRLLNGGRGL